MNDVFLNAIRQTTEDQKMLWNLSRLPLFLGYCFVLTVQKNLCPIPSIQPLVGAPLRENQGQETDRFAAAQPRVRRRSRNNQERSSS